jgi:hypothetical protein
MIVYFSDDIRQCKRPGGRLRQYYDGMYYWIATYDPMYRGHVSRINRCHFFMISLPSCSLTSAQATCLH